MYLRSPRVDLKERLQPETQMSLSRLSPSLGLLYFILQIDFLPVADAGACRQTNRSRMQSTKYLRNKDSERMGLRGTEPALG